MITLLVILIGVVLVVYNVIYLKKESNTNSFKDILDKNKDEVEDIDVKIGTLRREFAETILELQKEIVELKQQLGVAEKDVDDSIEAEIVEELTEEENVETENSVKINEVQALLEKGLTIDEVCEKLEIGKGEVLLIKDLYLK